jgi:hypothetical protein
MLDTLGNLGDFIGGIGVVITLAYLAVQIRHSSRVTALTSSHSITSSIAGFYERIAQDPELHSLWIRAMESPESLDNAEMDRFDRLITTLFTRCLDAHRHGELDPRIADRFDNTVRHYLRIAAVEGWWKRAETYLHSIDPELTAYIEDQRKIAGLDRLPPAQDGS